MQRITKLLLITAIVLFFIFIIKYFSREKEFVQKGGADLFIVTTEQINAIFDKIFNVNVTLTSEEKMMKKIVEKIKLVKVSKEKGHEEEQGDGEPKKKAKKNDKFLSLRSSQGFVENLFLTRQQGKEHTPGYILQNYFITKENINWKVIDDFISNMNNCQLNTCELTALYNLATSKSNKQITVTSLYNANFNKAGNNLALGIQVVRLQMNVNAIIQKFSVQGMYNNNDFIKNTEDMSGLSQTIAVKYNSLENNMDDLKTFLALLYCSYYSGDLDVFINCFIDPIKKLSDDANNDIFKSNDFKIYEDKQLLISELSQYKVYFKAIPNLIDHYIEMVKSVDTNANEMEGNDGSNAADSEYSADAEHSNANYFNDNDSEPNVRSPKRSLSGISDTDIDVVRKLKEHELSLNQLYQLIGTVKDEMIKNFIFAEINRRTVIQPKINKYENEIIRRYIDLQSITEDINLLEDEIETINNQIKETTIDITENQLIKENYEKIKGKTLNEVIENKIFGDAPLTEIFWGKIQEKLKEEIDLLNKLIKAKQEDIENKNVELAKKRPRLIELATEREKIKTDIDDYMKTSDANENELSAILVRIASEHQAELQRQYERRQQEVEKNQKVRNESIAAKKKENEERNKSIFGNLYSSINILKLIATLDDFKTQADAIMYWINNIPSIDFRGINDDTQENRKQQVVNTFEEVYKPYINNNDINILTNAYDNIKEISNKKLVEIIGAQDRLAELSAKIEEYIKSKIDEYNNDETEANIKTAIKEELIKLQQYCTANETIHSIETIKQPTTEKQAADNGDTNKDSEKQKNDETVSEEEEEKEENKEEAKKQFINEFNQKLQESITLEGIRDIILDGIYTYNIDNDWLPDDCNASAKDRILELLKLMDDKYATDDYKFAIDILDIEGTEPNGGRIKIGKLIELTENDVLDKYKEYINKKIENITNASNALRALTLINDYQQLSGKIEDFIDPYNTKVNALYAKKQEAAAAEAEEDTEKQEAAAAEANKARISALKFSLNIAYFNQDTDQVTLSPKDAIGEYDDDIMKQYVEEFINKRITTLSDLYTYCQIFSDINKLKERHTDTIIERIKALGKESADKLYKDLNGVDADLANVQKLRIYYNNHINVLNICKTLKIDTAILYSLKNEYNFINEFITPIFIKVYLKNMQDKDMNILTPALTTVLRNKPIFDKIAELYTINTLNDDINNAENYEINSYKIRLEEAEGTNKEEIMEEITKVYKQRRMSIPDELKQDGEELKGGGDTCDVKKMQKLFIEAFMHLKKIEGLLISPYSKVENKDKLISISFTYNSKNYHLMLKYYDKIDNNKLITLRGRFNDKKYLCSSVYIYRDEPNMNYQWFLSINDSINESDLNI